MRFLSVVHIILLSIGLITAEARADRLCVRNKVSTAGGNTKLKRALKVVTTDKCPKGFSSVLTTEAFEGPQGIQGVQGVAGPQGPTGSTGSAGADGLTRIYGDGTAGDVTIASGATLDPTLQYHNVTIPDTATVTAQSGLVVRATGTCEIDGTLNVGAAAFGGRKGLTTSASSIDVEYSPPHGGQAFSIPSTGQAAIDSTVTVSGGVGGTGMGDTDAKTLFRPGRFGGGGGAGGADAVASGTLRAGAGGGTLTLLCKGGIVIGELADIEANGTASSLNGGGGGGGGILIFATPVNVDSEGTLSVHGGKGGDSSGAGGSSANRIAQGGGGGGGFIHFIYGGTLVTGGPENVTGGLAGASNNVVAGYRSAGGGGGACYGSGGAGGGVASGGNLTSGGSAGSAGAILSTHADPGSFFL